MTFEAATFADQQGRYRLDRRIATGGMGEVWQATDTVLSRQVAVKLLKRELADDETFRSRFLTEARHAASLHHGGVASVFDFGEQIGNDGTGIPLPFLVMEYVDGRPLSEILRVHAPLNTDDVRHLMTQAADALGAAHRAGIVHRDVKPANLLVTADGTVKITDFGIARAADGVPLTLTGQILGTPSYLSPEQAEGHTATTASDVYALGVVMFECLSGSRPFVGDTPITTALAHLRDPVPALPDRVPADLRSLVERCLAKDPAARPPDAMTVARALRERADATAVLTPAVTPAPTTPTGVAPGTHPSWLAAAGLAAGAGTAIAAGAQHVRAGADRLTGHLEGRGVPGRFARWWPALAVALTVLAVVMGSAIAGGGGSGEAAAGDDPAPESAVEPVSDPAPERVTVRPERYVGLPAAEARSRLEELELRVREVQVPNPAALPAGTVAALRPVGEVVAGRRITLDVWAAEEDPGDDDDDEDSEDTPDSQGAAPPKDSKPPQGAKPPKPKGPKPDKTKGRP